MNAFRPVVLEQMLRVKEGRHRFTLGVPTPRGGMHRRMAITPEGVSILVSQGIDVLLEREAGQSIHYDDDRYARSGAQIVERTATLGADVVLYLSPLTETEASMLRPGALLLTIFDPAVQDLRAVQMLLQRRINVISLDAIRDFRGNRPVADMMGEVAGRAAIAMSASMLADAEHGKGILLGGVTGVNPCEVVILGSGMAARGAARSAAGLGAMVRMFDSDPYNLRDAVAELGGLVIASALHPRVIGKALATADVVVATRLTRHFSVDDSVVDTMKTGVIIFDLAARAGISSAFPTLQCIDMAGQKYGADERGDGRRCYINAADSVPRTTAMALTNELIPLIDRLFGSGAGLQNVLKTDRGLASGVMLYRGRVVNQHVAQALGFKPVDINIMLTFS